MADKERAASLAIERAILRLALLIERISKDQYVPVITGRLKSSIGGQAAPPPMEAGDALFVQERRGDVFEVLIGSNVVYAAVVEFGRNPSSHRDPEVGRQYRADVAKTTGGRSKRRTGSGRHGPYLRPALDDANRIGLPVVREELRRALGLI